MIQITIKYDNAANRVRVCHEGECLETVVPERIYGGLYGENWMFWNGKYIRLKILLEYLVSELYPAKSPAYTPEDKDRKFDHTCIVKYNDGSMTLDLDGDESSIPSLLPADETYTDFGFSRLSPDCIRVLRLLEANIPVS